MRGPQQTRNIGTITRVYKNKKNVTLAIDTISVTADKHRIGAEEWHWRVFTDTKRSLLHLEGPGADRQVDLIQMISDYNLIEEDGGDFLHATWTDDTGHTNDIEVFLDQVSKVGDTI